MVFLRILENGTYSVWSAPQAGEGNARSVGCMGGDPFRKRELLRGLSALGLAPSMEPVEGENPMADEPMPLSADWNVYHPEAGKAEALVALGSV